MNYESLYGEGGYDKIQPFNTVSKVHSKVQKGRGQSNSRKQPKLSIQAIQKEILKQIKISEESIEAFDEEIMKIVGQRNLYIYDSLNNGIQKEDKGINIQRLRSLEESIRRKDQTIRQIEDDIKMLKNGTYYDSKEKSGQNNFQNLGSEIKNQRQGLIKMQNALLTKLKEVNKKKQLIKTVENKYRDKCIKQGVQFLTFEEFKEAELKKRKQHKKNDKNRKPIQKKVMGSSIKQENLSDKHFSNNLANQNNSDSKKMKFLLSRKNVAQTALKTAKKKHNLQINDLWGKRDFLLDENQDLEEKLIAKQHELKLAEQKFSESRSSSATKKISERRYKTQRNI